MLGPSGGVAGGRGAHGPVQRQYVVDAISRVAQLRAACACVREGRRVLDLTDLTQYVPGLASVLPQDVSIERGMTLDATALFL